MYIVVLYKSVQITVFIVDILSSNRFFFLVFSKDKKRNLREHPWCLWLVPDDTAHFSHIHVVIICYQVKSQILGYTPSYRGPFLGLSLYGKRPYAWRLLSGRWGKIFL